MPGKVNGMSKVLKQAGPLPIWRKVADNLGGNRKLLGE